MPAAKPARKKRTQQTRATHRLKAIREKREAKEKATKPRSHEASKGKDSGTGGSPVKEESKLVELKSHPLADLLPMMSDAELQALAEDISKNGLRDEIVLFEDHVLDGRNRLAACKLTNEPPRYRTFNPKSEGSPLDYIVSKATHRNMNDSQKACAAVNVMDVFSAQGKERMSAGGKGVALAPPLREKSRDQAGALFGVSGRYIQDAKLLKEKAPELFKHAFAGRQPLSQLKRAYQRSLKLSDLKTKAKTHAAVSVSGSDWKIITGDCVEELKKLDTRPRLIFADPPYNLGFDYGAGAKADSLPEAKYLDWCEDWLLECARTLADDGSLLVMIDAGHQLSIGTMIDSIGCDLHWRNTIIWHETFGSYTDNNFTSCARFIHYFTKHKSRFVFNGDSVRIPSDRQAKYGDSRADPAGKVPGNVWTFPRLVDNAAERMPGFPTQVPLALMERIVLACSEPGDLVLDPFNGSGTTGHAALKHGRKYLGIEQVEQNAAFARARLANVLAERSAAK